MSNDIFSIISIAKPPYFLKFKNLEQGFAYFRNYRINLKTKIKENYPIENFLVFLDKVKFNREYKYPYIFHLFYELGHFFNGNLELIKDNDLLAIELSYLKVSTYKLRSAKKYPTLKRQKQIPFSVYEKKFNSGKKHLLDGNSYQLNLTFPYKFTLKEKIEFDDLIGKIWGVKEDRGAHAHATVIPFLNKTFISNSPECLFQLKREKSKISLRTMPIKGSLKIEGKKELKEKWETLKRCPKNQSELFMITDLLKNDLSRIERLGAKVIFKKRPLVVPKILHQFSLVTIDLSPDINLGKIIKNLFPGGSVTGAPKKKSMEILFGLESKKPRGFYCGSTLVFYKSILAGSINIRSATLDMEKGEFHYGSGGGITLQSIAEEEFSEMNLKFESFLNKIIN